MGTFTITRQIDAPADKVWAISGNFKQAPSSAIKIDVEDEGNPDANDIGAVRAITIGRVHLRERLESISPLNSFSYRLLFGAPVKDYLGKVEIKGADDTTEIVWSGMFTPKIPGTGWIVRRVAMQTVNRYIDAVESVLL